MSNISHGKNCSRYTRSPVLALARRQIEPQRPLAIMKNLSIGTRLTLGFAVVLSFLVALTCIGVWRMQQASVLTDNMVKQTVRNERLIDEWAKVIEVS
jgi:hypothetical protein